MYTSNPVIFWLSAAMLLTIIEMLTPFFGFVLIAGAALVGAGLAGLGAGPAIQVLGFGIATLLSLALLRPRIVAKLHSSANVPSRTEALMGKIGEVTESINPSTGEGRVLVEGQDWAASADKPLPTGKKVRIESVDGIVLKVKE